MIEARKDPTEYPVGDGAADLEMIRGALRADERSIRLLMVRMRCVARIVNGLNRKMGRPLDDHAVADSVQDTLIVIWTKLDCYQGTGALEHWVYRIAYLEFMNAVRRHRRRNRSTAGIQDDTCVGSEIGADIREERRLVEESLACLGSPEADVIRMKHYDGMTFEQIGNATEASVNTIKAQYYRGIDRLRSLLRRHMGVGA